MVSQRSRSVDSTKTTTRRESTMHPFPSDTTAQSAKQLPVLRLPTEQIPRGPQTSVTGEVQYLTDKEQRDATLQVEWSAWMSGVQKNTSVYKEVFVLLLSWHPECDDMSVANEVQSLAELFEDIYHFKVTNVLIDSREPSQPQAQVNAAVANFVLHNDQQNSLFLVYYAGHGSPGKNPGELKISGRRKHLKPNEWNDITWNLAESNLKATLSDVFLIFDCCYASDLGRDTLFNSRCFEYLAASASSYTRSPGPTSFTSALIWALKELAGKGQQLSSFHPPTVAMFTTSRLALKICEAPGFPKDQKPSLINRDIDTYQRIVLAPLPLQGTTAPLIIEEDEDDVKHTPECLDLTFCFKEEPDKMQLRKLADHLTRFMKLEGTSLHEVQWGGIRPPAHKSFRAVVHKVMQRRRSGSNMPNPYPGTGGLFHSTTFGTPNDTLTPPSPTEQTTLLSDNSRRNPTAEHRSKDQRARGLFSFFRPFWYPKTEVEGSVNGPQQNGHPSRPIKSSKSFSSRIRRVLRWFSPSVRDEA